MIRKNWSKHATLQRVLSLLLAFIFALQGAAPVMAMEISVDAAELQKNVEVYDSDYGQNHYVYIYTIPDASTEVTLTLGKQFDTNEGLMDGANGQYIAKTLYSSADGKNVQIKLDDCFKTSAAADIYGQPLLADTGWAGINEYYYAYGYVAGSNAEQIVDVFFVRESNKPSAGETPTGVDKSRLKELLDSVPITGYYKENDRWNGKEFSESGFYSELMVAVDKARAAYDESQSQGYVDAIADQLAAALQTIVPKLIPTTQLNATKLYEFLQEQDIDSRKESDYTSGSWALWKPFVDKAQAELDSLFDSDGNPTEKNKAERQAEVDTLAELPNSHRLVEKKYYDPEYQNYLDRREEALGLLDQYDPSRLNQSDYTADSWAAYVEAYETLQADMSHRFSGGTYEDWILVGRFDNMQPEPDSHSHIGDLIAARLQLTSSKDVTFSFTYVNNMTSRYPDFRKDGTDIYVNEEMKLTAGNTSIGDAISAAGIVFDTMDTRLGYLPGENSYNTSDTDPYLAVYIDGECVGSFFLSKLNNVKIQIPDGADVMVVRYAVPGKFSEASSGYDSVTVYDYMADEGAFKDSFAQIKVQPGVESAVVGDKVTFNGTVTGASYRHLGEKFSSEGLTLFISAPSDSAVLSSPSVKTTAVTGADGTLEYVFTKPGWYTVALFNLTDDSPQYTDVYRAVTPGTYPSMYAGGFALIYVGEASDEDALLVQYRTEKGEEATEFFGQFHDYDFAGGYYAEAFKPLYDALMANLQNATSFTSLMEQYAVDYQALVDASAKALDHGAIIESLRTDLSHFPGDLATMNSTYKTLVQKVQSAWAELNDYQKSLLTGNEIALLQALAAVDANALPTPGNVNLTISGGENIPYFSQGGGGDTGVLSSPNHNKTYTINPDGSYKQDQYKYAQWGNPAALAPVKAGQVLEIRRYFPQSDENYWMMYSLDGGNTWLQSENLIPDTTLTYRGEYFRFTYTIPYDVDSVDILLKVFSKTELNTWLAGKDAAIIADIREAATKSLEATYAEYDLSKYDDAGKTALANALNDGKNAINGATTAEAVADARKAAAKAMASVSTKDASVTQGSFDSGKTVGRVHVVIENTTWANGTFYGEGSIADGWYDIGENDTMMTVVLKVLESKGFYWNGNEDRDYKISYLASIRKDDSSLGEFNGSRGSGWMGTLNDWFVNMGFQNFSVANGQLENNDEIHIMFTLNYGEDLSGTWGNSDTSLGSLTISGGTLTPAFKGSDTEYMLIIPSESANVKVNPVPVNKNYQHRIFLNYYNTDSAMYKRTESIFVTSGDVLYVGVGESGWPTMNTGGKGTKYVIRVYTLEDALNALPSADGVNLNNYESYAETAQFLRDKIAEQNYTGSTAKLDAFEETIRFYSEIDALIELLDTCPAVDKLTLTHAEVINNASAMYDALSAEQKGYLTSAQVSYLTAAVEKINQLAADEVKALIDAIGTVDLTSEPAIKLARNAYDALTDEQKALVTNYKVLTDAEAKYQQLVDEATQAVIDKAAAEGVENLINAIGEVTKDSKTAIENARAAYNNLTENQKKLVSAEALAKLEAAEKAYSDLAVKDTIDLIDAIGTVTLESEEAIKDARTAYDSLTDAQKGLVTNYKVLTDAEAALKQLKDDKAAADAVIALIDSIGEVTAEDDQLIKDARAAYDALTDAQIKLVTNYEKLTAAEKEIAFLLATDEDKAAADAVEKMIEDIGTVTLDKADEITAARKAYIALTDLQKKLVENLTTLENAEKVLETLKAASAEDAYKSTGDYLKKLAEQYGLVVGSTGGEWIVIGLERAGVSIPDVEAYYKEVVKFVRAEINDKEQLHRAKSTENSRIILALTALGYDVTDVDGHNLLVGLTDMNYVTKQGPNGAIWALIAFDSHNYEIPAGGDVTREALIQAILADQFADGGWAMSGSKADPDMTAMAIQALAPYYSTNDTVKAAVDKALNTLSEIQNNDGTFGSVDGACSESCAQVIVALTALGIDPAEDARFIKNGISVVDALRTFYVEGGGFKHVMSGELDGMASEQSYYALAAYFRFKEGKNSLYNMTDVTIKVENPVIPDTTNEVAAENVDKIIDSIGNVTLDSENAIEAARDAYDALTDEQKALVKNLDVLTDAEAKLAELKKDAGITDPDKDPDDTTKPGEDPDDTTKPGEKPDVDSPQTGDNTNLPLYGGLMVVSLVALIALLMAERKRKYADKFGK